MALFDAPRCQHTKSNGIRCGSPALKDNLFCHYHHQCPTVVFDYHGGSFANYAESELSLPAFEDAHSIQSTVHKLVEFMLKHRIEDRKAHSFFMPCKLLPPTSNALSAKLPNRKKSSPSCPSTRCAHSTRNGSGFGRPSTPSLIKPIRPIHHPALPKTPCLHPEVLAETHEPPAPRGRTTALSIADYLRPPRRRPIIRRARGNPFLPLESYTLELRTSEATLILLCVIVSAIGIS